MSPMCSSMRNRMLGVWLLLCVAPTAVATANERTCIKNTGQSCSRSSFCEEQSGPAYCKLFRCFCLDHACAGVDKKCHTGANQYMEDVAAGQTYKIRNLKLNNLYLKAGGGVSLKDMPNENDNKFQWTLRKPPAMNPRRPAYLVYSKHWPDAVMRLESCRNSGDTIASNVTLDDFQDFLNDPNSTNNTMQDTTEGAEGKVVSASCHPQALSYYVQGDLNGLGRDFNIQELLSYLVQPPKTAQEANPGKQLVMIQNYKKDFLSANNQPLGADTWVGRDHYGTAGYWYFEPPLPAELYDKLPSYSEVSVSINTAPARSPRNLLVFSVACVLLAMASS